MHRKVICWNEWKKKNGLVHLINKASNGTEEGESYIVEENTLEDEIEGKKRENTGEYLNGEKSYKDTQKPREE